MIEAISQKPANKKLDKYYFDQVLKRDGADELEDDLYEIIEGSDDDNAFIDDDSIEELETDDEVEEVKEFYATKKRKKVEKRKLQKRVKLDVLMATPTIVELRASCSVSSFFCW